MISSFYIPTRIISGPGAFEKLGEEAAKLGGSALLVTGRRAARSSGLLDRAIENLEKHGVKTMVFDRIEPNPRASTVDEGAGMVRSGKLEMVIALGGGSAMDAAKGIVIAAAGGKPIWHYITTGETVEAPAPALITVPTVAASGSESNCGAVITNWQTREKCVVGQQCSYPAVSIVDPLLTLTLPLKPTLQGGVDIFCHLIEPYITATHPAPLTDGLVETALRMVVQNLPVAASDPTDTKARTNLSWASTIACSDFASLGGGDGAMTLHGIEHALSGYYDIAHGDGLAALLPAWMDYTYPVRRERFEQLGNNVFGAPDGVHAVKEWLKQVGMNLSLSELGVEETRIDSLAQNAVKTAPWLRMHPLPLDAEHVAELYRRSM